ncbi:MAG: VPLPA-CTERM sorting domain-containing protein [Nitrospira sp.]|nr:VPLPA-CTERM sorting domain-containing protein [Nitrospira sp.]
MSNDMSTGRNFSTWRVPLLMPLLSMALSAPVGAAVFPENFQTGTVGAFPSQWQDVAVNDRLVFPIDPLSPVPSGAVVSTTDAFGNPTKAFSPVEAIATGSGIFSPVPISTSYSVTADIRVDRFSDQSIGDGSDWAMQMGVVDTDAGASFANAPQVGVYASSFSQGWRLFNSSGGFDDIDLGVPVTLGTWYQVSMELDNATGNTRSIIRDNLTGTTLVDRTDPLTDWAGPVGFNALAFFDGELTPETTISNRAVVDNISFVPTPVPLPAAAWLFGSGVAGLAAWARRRMVRPQV